MGQRREIPVAQLLLDVQNPRLDEVQPSQPATLHRMLTSPKEKILPILRSIAKVGLDPTNSFLVMLAPNVTERYIVLEGNRRVAALKVLEHPELAAAAVSATQMKALREYHKIFRARGGIATVPAYVVATREEADQWLLLRHGGERQGAGLVRWGSTEKARFTERRLGQKDPALQVLDFVAKSGDLDDDTRARLKDVSRTNLERLVDDKAVRAHFGLSRHHGVITTVFDPAETVKLLAKAVTDLAHGRVNVTKLEKAPDRLKYVKSLGPPPSKATRLAAPEPLDLAVGAEIAPPARPTAKAAETTAAAARNTLIPRKTTCASTDSRVGELFRELRALDLEKYTNAGAVAFRVLLELSVNRYLVDRTIRKDDQLRVGLGQRVQEVVKDLKTKGLMTDAQFKPVNTLTSSDGIFGMDTFHAYVHSSYMSPTPLDLKRHWNNLSLFFETIWRPQESA